MKRLPIVLALAAAAGCLAPLAVARAQMPVPSTHTPTIYGAQVLPTGSTSIGASTGFASTRFQVVFGLKQKFDLALEPALTYGESNLSGYRQDVGLDFQVPLRFLLAESSGFNVGLRVVPFFRIGQLAPSVSGGGMIGARFGIPLPKIFTLFVGPEARLGFASAGPSGNRGTGFDGAVYGVFGIESFFKEKWFFVNEWHAGGYFGSGPFGGHGLLNVWFGFGRLFR